MGALRLSRHLRQRWSFQVVAAAYFTFVTPIVLRFKHSTWYENLWIGFCYLMLWHTGRLYYDVASHFLGLCMGVLVMHAQHTFDSCPRQRSEGWDWFSVAMQGSSMLHVPEPLKFFTSGIEYHHIHHLNTRVPMYRLRQCHDAAGALFADVRVVTMTEAIRDFRKMVLYDEDQNRFVGWDEIENVHPAARSKSSPRKVNRPAVVA